MTKRGPGVEGGVSDATVPSHAPWPARVLAVGAAIVLLAFVPDVFTRGDVLRSALLVFLAAVAAALGLFHPGMLGLRRGPTLLLLLPLAIPLLGLLAGGGGSSSASWLRHAAVWFAVAGLSLALVRVWRNRADVRQAWTLLVLAGTVSAVWTLIDALSRGDRGAGPFGRPGIAGPVLAALLAAALVVPRLSRGVRILLGLVLTVGLGATLSRTGGIAAVFGILGALALATEGRRRRLYAALLGGAAVAGVGAFVLLGAGALPEAARGETVQVRVGVWKATVHLVAERPLTGHGLGSFRSEVLRVRDNHEARLSRGRRPTVAHDDYLHAAAEAGIGAGLALLAWVGGVLALAVSLGRRSAPGEARRLGAACGGAFLALAVAAVGEDVFLDPAPALVAALAAAGLVALAVRSGRGTGAATGAAKSAATGGRRMLVDVALVLAGAGALAATGTTVRDALADRALRGYQTLLRDGTNPVEAATAAQVRLREGALAWRDDLPEAWYRLGVHHMEFGDPAGAREAWRAGLASDPGLTEAWLDIAASYEREGRLEDARAALLAAARHDPTRYDVQVRLGHLALGAEPVPGDASGSAMAEIAAHRHYNEAERLAPDRFETLVARARIARRRGALAEAGALLRAANERRPQAAEILLESFRLEEVEKVAHELVGVAILTRALLTDPSLAGLVEREADRFLGLGAERAAAAKDAVAGSLTEADYAAADRAYGAAARRLAGLLHARVRAPGPELAAARAHEEAKEWRPALARLRAVLSWAGFEPGELGATRKERLHSRADLFLRTAQVAARVDGPLSRHLYARAHAAQGAYLLETKEWDAARNVLAGAVEEAPRDPGVRIAYARALVHTGELDAAEDALLAALLLDPALAEQVRASGEFTALLEREDVAAALAR